MQNAKRAEMYRSFNEVIRVETQAERSLVNRKMLAVLLWCFLIPAVLALFGLALIRFGILPKWMRFWVDGVIVVFPVCYAIYYLSTEVIREIPRLFRRGGVANTLEQFNKDMEWRDRVCGEMLLHVKAETRDWSWIAQTLRIDLDALKARNRYLTALAGAVFFLILQGIDSIQDPSAIGGTSTLTGLRLYRVDGGITDPVQYVGLGLFLLLFYLAGSQTHQYLLRFLGCTELILKDRQENRLGGKEVRS